MNFPATPDQVERFRQLLAARLGLQFAETPMPWLGDVLDRRVSASGLAVEQYLGRLDLAMPDGEPGALAQELTVGETYFFRNAEQFDALRDRVVPERMGADAARRCLRVLSAGCASGEEPYSIAMTVRDLFVDGARELSIRAVDLNPAALEKARRGRYTSWSLRETSAAMQQRWFRQDGAELALDEAIRGAVSFEARNLGADDAELWRADAYDVVFCRNVLMYFTPQGARDLVARIARALAPGGYLFLGHAETLRGLSQEFHLMHTHGSFYYRRRDADESDSSPARDATDGARAGSAATIASGDGWAESIGKAAERVRALIGQAKPLDAPVASAVRRWTLGPALELFRQERFAQALRLVRELPREAAGDPNVLLLHAVLLAHGGQLGQAEDVCRRLLSIDELNAGAHYVCALCREGLGDSRGAADSDQFAVYLDPSFAMPHMHLGLLARRVGDHGAARRELAHAVTLLQREDAARLLLFGGGFGREALLALCRAELQACGEAT